MAKGSHILGQEPDGIIRINERSMEAIFNKFHASLVFFAYQFTRDEEAAHDVVTKKFMELWEDREKVEFKTEKAIRNYLYTGTRMRAMDYLRRNKTKQKALEGYLNLEAGFELQDSEDSTQFMAETIAMLSVAIETLPEQYKIAIELTLEGKTNLEIAGVLGVKESTVRSNMTRARAVLLKRFTGNPGLSILILFVGLIISL